MFVQHASSRERILVTDEAGLQGCKARVLKNLNLYRLPQSRCLIKGSHRRNQPEKRTEPFHFGEETRTVSDGRTHPNLTVSHPLLSRAQSATTRASSNISHSLTSGSGFSRAATSCHILTCNEADSIHNGSRGRRRSCSVELACNVLRADKLSSQQCMYFHVQQRANDAKAYVQTAPSTDESIKEAPESPA